MLIYYQSLVHRLTIIPIGVNYDFSSVSYLHLPFQVNFSMLQLPLNAMIVYGMPFVTLPPPEKQMNLAVQSAWLSVPNKSEHLYQVRNIFCSRSKLKLNQLNYRVLTWTERKKVNMSKVGSATATTKVHELAGRTGIQMLHLISLPKRTLLTSLKPWKMLRPLW